MLAWHGLFTKTGLPSTSATPVHLVLGLPEWHSANKPSLYFSSAIQVVINAFGFGCGYSQSVKLIEVKQCPHM